MNYPDARNVNVSHNANDLIQGVSTTINGQAQDIISNRVYCGNGLTQTRFFDDQGRLTDDNLGSINQRHNTFDANGNLTSRNESNGITNYTYDALNGVSNQYLIVSNRSCNTARRPSPPMRSATSMPGPVRMACRAR